MAPQSNFDVDIAGSKSDEFLAGTIKPMLAEKPHRWQLLMADAYAHVPHIAVTPARALVGSRRRQLVEDSSPVRSGPESE